MLAGQHGSVCTRAHAPTYMHNHTQTHAHLHAHAHVPMHTHTHVPACAHSYMCGMHVYTRARTPTGTRVYAHAHMHTDTRIHVHTRAIHTRMCTHACMHSLHSMHTGACTRRHTCMRIGTHAHPHVHAHACTMHVYTRTHAHARTPPHTLVRGPAAPQAAPAPTARTCFSGAPVRRRTPILEQTDRTRLNPASLHSPKTILWKRKATGPSVRLAFHGQQAESGRAPSAPSTRPFLISHNYKSPRSCENF